MKHHSKILVTCLILVLISASAYAVCWSVGTGHFCAGLNKSVYRPGERIVASGSGSGGMCSNGDQYLEMSIQGSTIFKRHDEGHRSMSGTRYFTAGTANGSITFTGCAWNSPYHGSNFYVRCGSARVSYEVNSPPSVNSVTIEKAIFSTLEKSFNQNHFLGFDDVVCNVIVSDPENDSMTLTANLCYALNQVENCVDSSSLTVSPGIHAFTFNIKNKVPVGARVYCTASATDGYTTRGRSSYTTATVESWDEGEVESVESDTTNIYNRSWRRFQ